MSDYGSPDTYNYTISSAGGNKIFIESNMGCANSVEDEGKEKNATGVNNTLSITSSCSEGGVDISHFSNNDKLLGVGGFGVVRLVVKNTGLDKDTSYALKSLSKSAVIKRPSGYGAVSNNCSISNSSVWSLLIIITIGFDRAKCTCSVEWPPIRM